MRDLWMVRLTHSCDSSKLASFTSWSDWLDWQKYSNCWSHARRSWRSSRQKWRLIRGWNVSFSPSFSSYSFSTSWPACSLCWLNLIRIVTRGCKIPPTSTWTTSTCTSHRATLWWPRWVRWAMATFRLELATRESSARCLCSLVSSHSTLSRELWPRSFRVMIARRPFCKSVSSIWTNCELKSTSLTTSTLRSRRLYSTIRSPILRV